MGIPLVKGFLISGIFPGFFRKLGTQKLLKGKFLEKIFNRFWVREKLGFPR